MSLQGRFGTSFASVVTTVGSLLNQANSAIETVKFIATGATPETLDQKEWAAELEVYSSNASMIYSSSLTMKCCLT
uniref:Uncharacterized protein n=1 Tax=Ditylenchus dipsaci TaxID=166011 RepID=A0A915D421_9BILA